jgi:DNA-binding HxlR family transcriptional regulator
VTFFSDPFPRARAASEGTPSAVRSTATASPLEATLQVLDGRWKALLVWQLFWGARPFCELMRRMPGITKKCLRRELAEMERHGLVCRTVRREGSAAYALTPLGETLKPIVGGMYEWGLRIAAPILRAPTREPARPPERAACPPDHLRAVVLRLLAEGPAKPRNL